MGFHDAQIDWALDDLRLMLRHVARKRCGMLNNIIFTLGAVVEIASDDEEGEETT